MPDQTRSLHLIDIENVTGCARPTADQVKAFRAIYEALHMKDGDLVVVASNHKAFATVGFAWPGVRHLVRSGPDGADTALLDVLHHEDVENRFNSVFVTSGDGIFTEATAWLGQLGVTVTVVSVAGRLARRLRMAAAFVHLLHPLQAHQETA